MAEGLPAAGNMEPFRRDDLEKIRRAVEAAEQRTRGEIVPLIVPASARYREAAHRGGLVGALGLLALFLMLDYWGWGSGGWLSVLPGYPGWLILAATAGYLLGSYLGSLPACVRWFVSEERMATKVRYRAERAFYEHGLHRTREATGLLIMVSLLERRVQILADHAINERVDPGTWDEVVKQLVDGIRKGRLTESLCWAIARCGELLAKHFPARPGDNPDELRDGLIKER